VFKIYPDSPAAAAGLAEKDVIVAVDDKPVISREDVTTALYTAGAGSPIRLEVKRGDRSFQATLEGVRPPEGLGLRFLERDIGLTVEESGGRLVVRQVTAGSLADRRGLRAGDLILGANGQELNSTEVLGREVVRGVDRGGLLLAVGRGRYIYNLDFPL